VDSELSDIRLANRAKELEGLFTGADVAETIVKKTGEDLEDTRLDRERAGRFKTTASSEEDPTADTAGIRADILRKLQEAFGPYQPEGPPLESFLDEQAAIAPATSSSSSPTATSGTTTSQLYTQNSSTRALAPPATKKDNPDSEG
jgi:hypothetical protein